MTQLPDGIENQRWLLEPLSAGEVRIAIAIDEGAQLTPEVSEAIERLTEALKQDEVQGYGQSTFLFQPTPYIAAEAAVKPGVCRSFRSYRGLPGFSGNPGTAGPS